MCSRSSSVCVQKHWWRGLEREERERVKERECKREGERQECSKQAAFGVSRCLQTLCTLVLILRRKKCPLFFLSRMQRETEASLT